jgi:4-hydroxy-tetrahydrodipicolinate reductase
MPIKVAVLGALGRMGSAACVAVAADPELELVAAISPGGVGRTIEGIEVTADVTAISVAGAQVAVDFTLVDASRRNLPWCAANAVHAVVGTSGLTVDDVTFLRAAFTQSNCVIAPNFAIGAVLMMRFAEIAAPFFETAEIVELHHDGKVDAPSGTALATAQRMAAASPDWAPDPTVHEVVAGARGGSGPGGIHVHALRLRGLVAHQEVILGTTGQTLTIRHDSYDRASFMPGIVLACKRVADHPGVTLGLEALLGL